MEKQTIPVVYFSFRDDAALLAQSVRALRLLMARDQSLHIPVYVFDDSEHPLQSVPDGVYYEATGFPRNGNLIGLECLMGMVDCYNKVFALEPDARVLVKCDCDTILNNMELARACEGVALTGTKWGGGAGYVCGERYAVSRGAAQIARAVVHRDAFAQVLATSGIIGEDASLTAACRLVPGCRVLFFKDDGGILPRREFARVDDARLRKFGAVVFKLQFHHGGNKASERADAARLMREYNDITETMMQGT